jgi:hypothetical protein
MKNQDDVLPSEFDCKEIDRELTFAISQTSTPCQSTGSGSLIRCFRRELNAQVVGDPSSRLDKSICRVGLPVLRDKKSRSLSYVSSVAWMQLMLIELTPTNVR